MKKFITLIVIIILAIAGYEYYTRHHAQITNFAQGLQSGAAIENIRTEIFTPGGLRAKFEVPNARLTAAGIIEQTNAQRGDFGQSALKENEQLNQAALAKVKDMFAGQYFEHISPLGKGPADLAKAAGYLYVSIGENLALGNYKDDAALVEAWMNSPGHRANILNSKFSEIGVAAARGSFEGKTTWLAVQEFGRPARDCPPIDAFLKDQIDAGKLEAGKLERQVKDAKAQLDSWPEAQSQAEVDAYNQKVAEYNSLVRIFNNRVDTQKDMVSRYNEQIKAFNQCIGK